MTASEAAALRDRARAHLMGATVDRQELEREAAEAAERQREAIRAAFAAGWRPREIGAITGLSRQRIYEITKESR